MMMMRRMRSSGSARRVRSSSTLPLNDLHGVEGGPCLLQAQIARPLRMQDEALHDLDRLFFFVAAAAAFECALGSMQCDGVSQLVATPQMAFACERH